MLWKTGMTGMPPTALTSNWATGKRMGVESEILTRHDLGRAGGKRRSCIKRCVKKAMYIPRYP